MSRKYNVLVIETGDGDDKPLQYGISFAGPNPPADMYFGMASKEDAFRLENFLMEREPEKYLTHIPEAGPIDLHDPYRNL